MRKMPSPDNQMALTGLDPKGCQRMEDARAECARTHDGKASPNRALYGMRIKFSIELPNHLAPYLARIAMEQDKTIRMRVARSDADGYTTAVLR